MTSAAETVPRAMLRFSEARASRILLARSSARRRCGSGVFRAVCVIYRSHFPTLKSAAADVDQYRRLSDATHPETAGPAVISSQLALMSGDGFPEACFAPRWPFAPRGHHLATNGKLEQTDWTQQRHTAPT